MFDIHPSILDNDISDFLLPSKIVCSNKITLEKLKRNFLNIHFIKYSNNNFKQKINLDSLKEKKFDIVLLPEAYLNENLIFLKFVESISYSPMNKNIYFYLKLHPYAVNKELITNFVKNLQKKINIKIINDFNFDINFIIYRGSTAVTSYMKYGKIPLYLVSSPNEINIDLLRTNKNFSYNINNFKDLEKILLKYKDNLDLFINDSKKILNLYNNNF